MAPPTILAHKSAFLHAQTLQLSQGLAPSAGWRASWQEATATAADDENENENEDRAKAAARRLTAKAVDEAVYKLNHKLQQHARRVYAPQATRNVAEQTDALFLGLGTTTPGADAEADENSATGNVGGGLPGAGEEEEDLRQGVDLALDSTIAALPPTWDQLRPTEATAHPTEAQRYAEQQARLGALAARRAETRARLERLRAMERLLRPFRDDGTTNHNNEDDDGGGSGATTTLQQNLVTRNGEVEKELERMRTLLVRVAGRVAQLPDRPAASSAETVPDLDEVEREKVRHLLDSL